MVSADWQQGQQTVLVQRLPRPFKRGNLYYPEQYFLSIVVVPAALGLVFCLFWIIAIAHSLQLSSMVQCGRRGSSFSKGRHRDSFHSMCLVNTLCLILVFIYCCLYYSCLHGPCSSLCQYRTKPTAVSAQPCLSTGVCCLYPALFLS